MKLKHYLIGLFVGAAGIASAQVVGNLPFTLTNNTIADANQVMANFNAIVSDVNTNAATAGVNSNITSIIGLTTPLSPSQGGSSVYTFGTSTGSANAQVVASPSPTEFVVAQGRRITFVAGFTNTGATKLNVNSTGALDVYKATTGGVAALNGGEIVAGAVVDAWYNGTQYVLLNASPQALVPTGALQAFTGVDVPSGWSLANGGTLTRAAQPALFAASNRTFSATTTATSTSVLVADSSIFQVGWFVGGTNVTCNVTITAIPDATHITISIAAGTSGVTTLDAGPWGLGDCTTTYNKPNFTGRIAAGMDGATFITSATCTNAGSLGSYCGTQTILINTTNLPATNIGADASTAIWNTVASVGGTADGGASQPVVVGLFNGGAGGGGVSNFNSAPGLSGGNILVNLNSGVQTAVNKLPPVGLVYKIVKL